MAEVKKTELFSRPVASAQNTVENFAVLWKWFAAERLGNLKDSCVGGPPKSCDLPTEPTPEGIDWDAWLDQLPCGFNKILCPDDVHNHFPPGVATENTVMVVLPTWVPTFRHWTMGYGR